MKLYLSSYLEGNKSEYFSQWLNAANSKKVFVIGNALDCYPDSERKTNGFINKSQFLKDMGYEVEILDLKNYFSKEETLKEKCKEAQTFYVLGGNVFVLRTAMKLSGFDKILLDLSKQDDVLYSGFSAGICVLAKDLHGIHLADDEKQDPYNTNEVIWEGIGLLDYMPIPHWESPEHQESHLMPPVLEYLHSRNIKYKTMKDGDVDIIDLAKTKNINIIKE